MKHNHFSKSVALLALTVAAAAAQANFASVIIDRMQDPYGKLSGMKKHDSLLSTVESGQFRRYSRIGNWPLPRRESDFRTGELEIDPYSWLESLPQEEQRALLRHLQSEQSFGSGALEFSRSKMDRGQFEGIFKVVTSTLGISVSGADASTLVVKMSWDDVSVREFRPNGLSFLSNALQKNGNDPYRFFAGLRRHESWMITKTVSVKGLKVEIYSAKPQSGLSFNVTGVGGFESKLESEGHFVVSMSHPVVLASAARNVGRSDIYKYAGLNTPRL